MSICLFFIPVIGPFLMGALAFLITKIGLGLSIGACITAGTMVFGTGVGVGKFVNIDDNIKIPSTCLPCFSFFKHKDNQNFGSNFSTTVDNQPK